jgi:hypothetical protein
MNYRKEDIRAGIYMTGGDYPVTKAVFRDDIVTKSVPVAFGTPVEDLAAIRERIRVAKAKIDELQVTVRRR